MVSFEELSQKYPTHNVPPYGMCVVVPGDEFDPDWEALLEDCSCHFTDFEGKSVTLVQQAHKNKGEGVVYVPPKPVAASAEAKGKKQTLIPGARSSPSQKWRPEEDKVLVKLWNERVLIEKMTPSFPGRTEAAIRLRIQRLEKYGKIKKRTGRGRQKLRSDYGFKKKFPQKIIDFAVSLSKSEDPAYSTRDIAKKILEKFEIEISNVSVQKWIVEAATQAETPKETLDVSIEEVERLLFVRGVGYCVRLSENLCQKLGLKEKDFLIIQLEKGKDSIRLIPADIRPRKLSHKSNLL